MTEQKSFSFFVSYLQLKSQGIISHPPLIKTIQVFLLIRDDLPQIDKLAIIWRLSKFISGIIYSPTNTKWMFLLLYTFISFRASPAGAVSHCLPLSP